MPSNVAACMPGGNVPTVVIAIAGAKPIAVKRRGVAGERHRVGKRRTDHELTAHDRSRDTVRAAGARPPARR